MNGNSSTSSGAAKLRTDPLPVRRINAHGRRLSLPLLISLVVHALLLSLSFGSEEFGLPGLAFPWQDRRVAVPDLRVVLAPAPAPPKEAKPVITFAPPAAPPALIELTRPTASAAVTFKSPERPPVIASPSATTTKTSPQPKAATVTPPAQAPAEAPNDAPAEATADAAPPPKPFPSVIALEESKEPEFVVPPAPPEPKPTVSKAPEETGRAEQARAEQEARERLAEEAERQEKARQAAAQREQAQQAAARQETAQQEAARQEAARAEAAQREGERQEKARQAAAQREQAQQAAARQEAAQQEAARQEAARAESAQREAERQEKARQAAAQREQSQQAVARQEAAQQEAARQEAARAESAQRDAERQAAASKDLAQREAIREQDAKRDAARRAMGRQLDEEAARRDAAQAATRLSPGSSGLRRGRLFGRTDPNAELIRYAEAWSRKIQLNMGFELAREPAKQPHTDPIVTVAIRSDGSVESISIVRTSGVPAIDEAIRSIVQNQTPYLPFQPALVREFDVIEIRRTWHFDTAIRLY